MMDPITIMGILGLAAKAVPTIAGWFGGKDAEKVTKDVVDSVSGLFGTTDPKEIEKKIAAQPELWVQWQSKLAEIQDKASQRQHEERMAEFADVVDARKLQASTNSKTVPVLAIITVAAFFIVNGVALYGGYYLISHDIQLKNIEFALACATTMGTILGWVNSKADMVWGFFFGSSKGSEDKTTAMSASITGLLKKSIGK